ncbi:uncharacterized protein [Mytilus edulis]|uniref:uncharacterized protein n=1 Tax=Mytilus edulis TaxID=6550 RepID=UPI0039F0B11A
MKIRVVAALLCLIVFLHSEGKPQCKGKYKNKAKYNYKLSGERYVNYDQENQCKKCKAPCKTLPTTCPDGYTKLTNQSISSNCYLFGGSNTENRTDWHVANAICTSTPGAYLWIPDSREEAEAVLVKFDIYGKLDQFDVFTGANNLADRNSYVYAGTNDIFDPTNLPYGIQIGDDPLLNNKSCFELEWDLGRLDFEWDSDSCSGEIEAYVCEFPIAEACY